MVPRFITPDSLLAIWINHSIRYPAWQLQDLYKLLVQAALGSEHAVSDPPSAQRWLERELGEMGAGPDEPIFDPITPDERMIRVHLRSFLAAGCHPQSLLEAFLATATTYHGSREQLASWCSLAIEMCQNGDLPFNAQEAQAFFAEMGENGYPAVHHSPVYQRLYHPAYRVVLRALIEPDEA
ncbi:MAG: hypothetical protein JXB15_05255 [Anaerolineales bacterium]|nr:hypothetical protein [Anaerolineales bacterium]